MSLSSFKRPSVLNIWVQRAFVSMAEGLWMQLDSERSWVQFRIVWGEHMHMHMLLGTPSTYTYNTEHTAYMCPMHVSTGHYFDFFFFVARSYTCSFVLRLFYARIILRRRFAYYYNNWISFIDRQICYGFRCSIIQWELYGVVDSERLYNLLGIYTISIAVHIQI